MHSRRTGYALAVAGLMATLPAVAQQNNALLCNGHGDYLAAQSLVDVTNDFTIETWINPTEPDEIDVESVASFAGVSGQHFVLYPVHGTECWGAGHAGVGISAGTNGVSVFEHAAYHMPALLVYEGRIDGWTHVAVVFRDRTPSLYINGELVRTGIRSSYANVHPSAGAKPRRVVMGGIGGGNYGYFAGMIDDLRIWDRPLGEGEIASNIERGVSASAPGLVLDFDMNRIGAGAGLVVENVAGKQSAALQSAGLAAVTFGTATTPIFVPRNRMESVAGVESGTTESAIAGVSLEQNVPNPVSGETVIRFTTPTAGPVRLVVTDVRGREVALLMEGTKSAGAHEVHLNVASLPASGEYYYTLTAGGATMTRSMQVVK